MLKKLCALLLVLAASSPATAAPPATLGYQGRLATSGGQPISANLNITFRIYDVASGGSALWTEVQPSVPVDGGNLAVELGKVTPLPASIFGRQLYLGVQVAGDSEMAPRPPLTAAPYALRAASTMKNTIHVSAEGSPTDMGTALLAAATTAASNPGMAIELDAGTYDLGSAALELPQGTTLSGRSQLATRITSSNEVGTVFLASNTSVRDLTAVANGTPGAGSSAVTAVSAAPPNFNGTPVENVRIERVTGIAEGATGALGARNGFYVCASNSRVADVTAYGQGGQFSVAFRADCANATNSIYERVVVYAFSSSDGIRGAYLGGAGMTWRHFKAYVTYNPTAQTTYGIRMFSATIDNTSLLSDAIVDVRGNAATQAVDSLIEAVRIDNANVDLERVRATVDSSRVSSSVGLRINSVDGNHVVRADDLTISVTGVQVPVGGFGAIDGILAVNAAPRISRAKVDVQCTAGGTYECAGIARRFNATLGTLQSATLTLDHADVTVTQVNAADSTASTNAYSGVGQARISGSTLRVVRSPFGEFNSAVISRTNASVQVFGSTLLVESTATPTPDCSFGGDGGIELFGNVVQGVNCASGPAPICIGNTRRGLGPIQNAFLASSCP